MIPVLGVPILNGPDHLVNMLASVDHLVAQTVIVDNGGVVDGIDACVIRPGHNLGCCASWNLILKSRPAAPWWFLTNHDMVFAPGDLGRMVEAMDNATGPHMAIIEGFSAFALNAATLATVGYFDENFHPAYYEDNDYVRRCLLAKVPLVSVAASSAHVGSATIYGDKQYRKENGRTFQINQDYYLAKWGGHPGLETFETPFDRGGDIRDVTVDPKRLKELTWANG